MLIQHVFDHRKKGTTKPGSDPHRTTLPIVLHPVHSGPTLEGWQNNAQTFHQIHLSLGFVLFIPL